MRFQVAFVVLIAFIVTLAAGRSALDCKPGTHKCRDGSRCISRDFLCDGIFDCGNGEDEANCASPASAPKMSSVDEVLNEREIPTFNLEFGNVRNL